jgi:hypothetical protein
VLAPAGAALAVVAIGQVAFFVAVLALIARIVPAPARWWSLALLAVVSGFYGGVGTFRIAEPFATARTLAEPLVVAALACCAAARPRAALALLALAALLHPLVAGTGVAVLLLWHTLPRTRLAAALLAAACALALVVVLWPGVPRIDAEWRAVLQARSPHLFLAEWFLPDWSRVLWGFGVLWLAARLVAPARRLVLAVAVCGSAGIVLSGIAVDGFGSAAAAALQFWRAHWLVQVLAIVLVPATATALWSRGGAGSVAAACLVASCCFGRDEQLAAALLLLATVILEVAGRRWPGLLRGRSEQAGVALALAAGVIGLMFEVQSRLPPEYGIQESARWQDMVHAGASVGGLLPLAAILWLAACSRLRLAALAVSVAALALALAAWDARRPWPRFVDEASGAPNPFRDVLPPGAVVFWPDPHTPSWLVLRRAAWYSADQGAGIVFSRATALAYAERRNASRTLSLANEDCRMSGRAACRIDRAIARALCGMQDGPSHLVLAAPVADTPATSWQLPRHRKPVPDVLYMQSCADIAGNKKAGTRPAFLKSA